MSISSTTSTTPASTCLTNWDRQHSGTGGTLTIEWDELTQKYHQRRVANVKAARQAKAVAT